MSRLYTWHCKLLDPDNNDCKLVCLADEIRKHVATTEPSKVADAIAAEFKVRHVLSMYGSDHAELLGSPGKPVSKHLLAGIRIAALEPGTPILAPFRLTVVKIFDTDLCGLSVVYRMDEEFSGAPYLLVGNLERVTGLAPGHVHEEGQTIGHVSKEDTGSFPYIDVQLIKSAVWERVREIGIPTYASDCKTLDEWGADPTLLVFDYPTLQHCLLL